MALNSVIGCGIMVASTVLFWGWLVVARRVARYHQVVHGADPPSMELGDEPPAVVNYLLHGLRVTPDAVGATVLDLAARKQLEVIELDPTHNLIRLGRRADGSDGLEQFEAPILAAVRHAIGVDGTATVKALAEAFAPHSASTWLTLKTAVTKAAAAQGLTTESSKVSNWAVIGLPALFTTGYVIALPALFITIPVPLLGFLVLAVILRIRGRATVLTEKGQAVGRRWAGVKHFLQQDGSFDRLPSGAVAIWDRYLAYAAAMGLSGPAVRGVVTELRTTLSVSDAKETAAGVHAMWDWMHGDPRQIEQLERKALTEKYPDGPDLDTVFGPSGGSFSDLVRRTAQSWKASSGVAKTAPDRWRRAAMRRINDLVDAAPPEVAVDVISVAQMVRAVIAATETAGTTAEGGGASSASDPAAMLDALPVALKEPLGRIEAYLASQPASADMAKSLGVDAADLASVLRDLKRSSPSVR